jgi:hypothetical protein
MIGPEDVRRLALALPEAHEEPHFDSTSFRVKGKIFATMDPAFADGSFVLKLDPEDQHNLVEGHSGRVAPVDGYWGRSGWTRVRARDLSADDLAGFLQMAWSNVAPKKLAKAFAESRDKAG